MRVIQYLKSILRAITPPVLWRSFTNAPQEPPTKIETANRQWWANVHRSENMLND